MADSSLASELAPLSQRLWHKIEPMLRSSCRAARQRSQIVAMQNWLQKYAVSEPEPPLAQVQGILEAFYHCCDGHVWPVAHLIARLAIAGESTLIEQIGRWGDYGQQRQMGDRLLGSVEDPDSFYLLILGQAHYGLSDYAQAQSYYQRCLTLVEIGRASCRERV